MPLIALTRSTFGRSAVTLAGAAAVALFAGCGGSDSSTAGSGGSTGGASKSITTASAGAQIFKDAGCTSCHTLADAGSKGNIGPNLDDEKPSAEEGIDKVTNGDGSMPSFKNRLSEAQIKAVATYVSEVAGK